jgi:hypothetical protein
MNGGISGTSTPSTDQNNDPAALLNTLMSSPENAGASSGTPRDGIFGYGYYDDVAGSFTKADRPAVTPPAGGTAGSAAGGAAGGPAQNGYLWSDGTFHATPEPSAGGTTTGGTAGGTAGGTTGGAAGGGRARPFVPAGEGSVNEEARKRGEMLSAFLASFQAAYQRKNPNFNFTRNPRLAKGLGLPWSGDLGR